MASTRFETPPEVYSYMQAQLFRELERVMSTYKDRFLVTDENIKALSAIGKTTVAVRARLVNYLRDHEHDIAFDINDFGQLKPVFEQIFNRAPKP